MKIKYQIFVSSTYVDLKEERDLVIKAILEMGHIPVGMEMFSAGDEEQWKLIQKQIDDCDYYVVIVAHRYGSMDGKVGYTEKEYDYAIAKEIPALGFLINHDAEWGANKFETEAEKIKRLTDFKSKIKRKLISFWSSKDDLYGKVSIALMKQFTTNPRDGWVKATELVGPEVITEISRLSKENSELRNQIDKLQSEQIKDETEKYDKTINTLQGNKINLPFFYERGREWEDYTEFTFYKLFKLLAPELMVEKSTNDTAGFIGRILKPNENKQVRNTWAVPSNKLKEFFADLSVLGLVEPSIKNRSVKDDKDYWKLTIEGKKLYKRIKREILEYLRDGEDDKKIIDIEENPIDNSTEKEK